MNNIYKKILWAISQLLNCSFEDEKTAFKEIFKKMSKLVEFDEAALYYLNTDRLNLQFSLGKSKKADFFSITPKMQKELYSKKPLIIDENSDFIKNLKQKSFCKNYAIVKLLLKGTVFGAVFVGRNNGSYTEIEIEALDIFSQIISYVIKDNELSNVFKIQLKALQANIIEREIAYKTIEKQNVKIIEADKAKNEFLANITHELRTPLNAIIGFSDILKEQIFGKLNKKQSEYINDISVSAIHLLGMINEILDLSKIEAKAMNVFITKMNASVALNEVINILKPLSDKKSIKVINTIKSEIYIDSDFQKIQQILYNLLSNAIKFTDECGQIEIGARTEKNKFIFFVKDNGIGIDKKYQGKIWGKFVQLESAYTKKESSTGLGLTVTKELVELLKGKIRVESLINQGSTFIVELPKKLKIN